ncbi:tuberoinfundibular peptide of 39 residues isoform X1 [Trematomus bernacchii]|uniref:tuberoinfundibular peptide of 39 residues isoform X1 n=1 Tax=Trematomus bernacchii TaxID=40690 RepID=UPI00146CA6B3|nr:tuberoinfundibular peptide of 39 residues isoform X1 [Trematomus bernacchii]XP_033991082.1 tuberoinfundibular peptide of 39 residues isoform X1 [Trematomus bernacchii]
MSDLLAFPRMSFLLLCILGMILVTSGFPQHRLHLRSDSEEPKREEWDVLIPSISLRDWSIEMMSAPSLGAAANSNAGLMREAWLFGPERAEERTDPGVSVCVSSVRGAWPAEWTHGASMKRNMVVADDAAFREKSKLLTSMERQKWLNSYMQKLLVVNSS